MHDLYRFYINKGTSRVAAGQVVLSENIPAAAAELLRKLNLALKVTFRMVTPAELLDKTREFFAVDEMRERSYLVECTNGNAVIYAAGAAGCFYAVQTIVELLRQAPDQGFTVAASPRGSSGIKLYLPEPTAEGFEEFKRIIDLAAFCRCSFVMLELGGALEYKSHPEINSAWIEYCKIMNEYPGKTLDVQNNYPWHKNSIHSENGGGRFLTQKEFMFLVDYCRGRFLEVIPEMPSLSHSDYLLFAHRNLAERPLDPFPDACCPLNDDYHKLYNELLDEVIELMQPERINIGHDELYTVCQCPHCRGKDPAQLYAGDINRIAGYLAAKNVKTMIWGEKLLNSHWQNGAAIGGAALPASAGKEGVPAFYSALEHITEKVEIMHWYWTVDRRLDDVYGKNGLTYYFGNLNPVMFKDWSKRISAPYAAGTCVSNWGQTNWRTLQRNGVLYDLVYTSFLMWNDLLSEDDFNKIDTAVFAFLERWRKSFEVPGSRYLEVVHTVKTNIKFQYFFDGFLLDESTFLLGDHIFADNAGNEYRFPVIFGSNISNDDVTAERGSDPEGLRDAWVYDLQHTEVAGECMKIYEDSRVWYQCCYKLPDSADDLHYVKFEPHPGIEVPVNCQCRSFRERCSTNC